ncbi:MAG TPA: MerR family transcriptional regulator [Bacteriovoracaceae bacterium]|nr:MerR family transcriptional regulator [Bacteriovoracaceae bacterium]
MILINDFSKQTNISIRMLRYLEEMGLLRPVRAENNYRYYSQDQVAQAAQIKELQELGFQLKEVKELRGHTGKHREILSHVLTRELEVAEIKSESIPKLKYILSMLEKDNGSIFELLAKKGNKDLPALKNFKRTVSPIPALINVFSDLEKMAKITNLSTDVMTFSNFMSECEHQLQVYTIVNETTFLFGHHLTGTVISQLGETWEKELSSLDLVPLEGLPLER